MPCYLFTYHAYGTWLPDRSKGFVHRKRGLQPTDAKLADNYRENMEEANVAFGTELQKLLVETLQEARCHAIATDGSHIHVLTSWSHDRGWQSISKALKTSLSLKLNEQHGRRKWFSKGSSRKQVTKTASTSITSSKATCQATEASVGASPPTPPATRSVAAILERSPPRTPRVPFPSAKKLRPTTAS